MDSGGSITAQVTGLWQTLEECRSTRALLACLTLFWLIGMAVPGAATLFAMVPAHTFNVHHYVWNLATAGLFETSLVMGALNIAVAAVVCPVLERAWGSTAFFKFVAIVNVACNASILLLTIVLFGVTQNEQYLFARVCGFSGVNAAFAVALKQRFAERPVLNVSAFAAVKIKHIPMVISALAIVLWSVGRMGGKESPLVIFGVVYAWLYLRFYFVDADTGVVGDLRDDFAFDTLFPSAFGIRGVVGAAGLVLSKLLQAIGFCKDAYKSHAMHLPDRDTARAAGAADAASAPLIGGGGGGGGAANSTSPFAYNPLALDPNAERRRAMAIKAIDDKLAELNRQAALAQQQQPQSPAAAMAATASTTDATAATDANTTAGAH